MLSGGYWGGASGSSINCGDGAGGGGSGYFGGCTKGNSSVGSSGAVSGNAQPPMVIDPDYIAGIGIGGLSNQFGGQGYGGNGLIVIYVSLGKLFFLTTYLYFIFLSN